MKKRKSEQSDPAISSMRRGQLPEYFKTLPKASNAEYWDEISNQFQDLRYWIANWQVETEHEFRANVTRTDRTIPYISGEITDELNELLFYTRSWVHKLESLIDRRKATPEFLSLWGGFNSNVGRINTYWSLTPNKTDALAGSEISRKKTNKDQHRIWYSHAFLTLKASNPGSVRDDIDDLVKKHILELLDKNYMAKEGFGRKWFEGFFDGFTDRQIQFMKEKNTEPRENWHYLTAAFKDKKLSIKAMRRIVNRHPVILPDTNLD